MDFRPQIRRHSRQYLTAQTGSLGIFASHADTVILDAQPHRSTVIMAQQDADFPTLTRLIGVFNRIGNQFGHDP